VAAAAGTGAAAVLLAFAALVLVLDAVVPMPGRTWPEADDHFRRMLRRRWLAAWTRRMRGLPPERLALLEDRAGWAATAERRALGVQPVAVASITGTVEATKARTFDRAFRPDASAREHWKRLWIAQVHGASLPPITVYRVGPDHYVIDGHHRVSVALDLEVSTLDADVIELRAPAAIADRRPAAA
jgi:hypothetical protein